MPCGLCGSDEPDDAGICARCGVLPVRPRPAGPSTSPREGQASSALRNTGDERKLVTVFFADISGFTALAETLDPEPLRDLLNDLFDRLVPSVETYGGTVDKFIGDCLMALFGAPITHDDDAVRAVRAALEMRDTLAGFNRERGIDLAVHFGVNTGRVVAGFVGGGSRRDYSVVGDVVNVAKRLEEASAPGEILIGPDTRRSTAHLFDAEVAGTIAVRERTEGVVSYRVIGDRAGGREASPAERSRSRLIGREAELNVFTAALGRLREGHGGAVLVLGEAGLGKSRLFAEARRHDAAISEVTWLEGRTASFGHSLSYLPFKEIVRTDAGFRPGDDAETRSSKLHARLDAVLGEESVEATPYLSQLLGLPVPDEIAQRLAGMDEHGVRAQLFESYKRYLARLAGIRPLSLVLEDVHWLDASSSALLDHLLPLAMERPILFCLSSRPGPGGGFFDHLGRLRHRLGTRLAEIPLRPLSSRQAGELVGSLLGDRPLPAGLERAITDRSGGNPFFAEEVVRHLIDVGALACDPAGGWRATRDVSRMAIPDTLQGVIAARVDMLPEGAKRHLGLASVIGRAFSHRLLAALAGDDASALQLSLDHLEESELICRRAGVPELVFVFKHALIQEATYESILVKRRKELHLAVAGAIEGLTHEGDTDPSGDGDSSGLLAYHYTRAEEWDRARDHLMKAGERAAATAGDAEARWHYQQAMAALLQSFDGTWQAPGRGDPVEWFVKRLEPFWETRQLGDLLESIEVFHRTVVGTCGPDDPRAIEAACMLAASQIHNHAMLEAQRLLEPVVGAQESGTRAGMRSLSRAFLLLGMIRLNQDRFPEAERLLARAISVELSRPDPDWGILHDAYTCLSSSYYFMGQIDRARRLLEEAVARRCSAGSRPDWGLLLNLSSFHLIAGDVAEAAVHARRCLEEAANPYVRAHAARHVAAVYHAEGAYSDAEEHLVQAVKGLDALGRESDAAMVLTDLAETRLQKGDLDAAQESAEAALRKFQSAGHGGLVLAPAYWSLAGVAVTRGFLEEAERLLEKGREIAEATSSPRDPLRAELVFRLANVRRLQGRLEEAETLRRQAAATICELGGDRHPRLRSMGLEWEA